MTKHRGVAGVVLALLVPLAVWAGNLVLPFTFHAGDVIRASEVNANFTAVKDSVDDLDARLSSASGGSAHSGSRLKLLVLESDDGAAVPYSGSSYYWDSQLQTMCLLLTASSSAYVQPAEGFPCVPYGVGTTSSSSQVVYTDPTCLTKAVIGGGSTVDLSAFFGLDGGLRYASTVWSDGGLDVYRLGPNSAAPEPVYGLRPDGGCAVAGNSVLAPITATLSAADLAHLKFRVR